MSTHFLHLLSQPIRSHSLGLQSRPISFLHADFYTRVPSSVIAVNLCVASVAVIFHSFSFVITGNNTVINDSPTHYLEGEVCGNMFELGPVANIQEDHLESNGGSQWIQYKNNEVHHPPSVTNEAFHQINECFNHCSQQSIYMVLHPLYRVVTFMELQNIQNHLSNAFLWGKLHLCCTGALSFVFLTVYLHSSA